MIFRTLSGVLSALLIVGCSGGSGSDDDTPPNDISNGSSVLVGLENCVQPVANASLLCGAVTAADGVTPLIGATIAMDTAANPDVATGALRGVADSSQCLTDAQGEFACVLPDSLNGIIKFVLSAAGFDAVTFEENIVPGEIAQAQPQTLDADATVQWAVITGVFDGVQVLLSQLKGCTLNDSEGNPWDISNPNPATSRGSTDCESKGLRVIDGTDTAFFTDGSLDQYDAIFVNCDADLSSPEVNAALRTFNANGGHAYFSDLSDLWLTDAFPGKINFAGNQTNTDPNLPATVADANLAAVVGNQINLVFDFPIWTAMDSVSDDSTVYIEADLTSVSNYPGIKPITVGFKSVQSGGCVFYTSYHIEGASSGAAQELAIKYLVQNIGTVCA